MTATGIGPLDPTRYPVADSAIPAVRREMIRPAANPMIASGSPQPLPRARFGRADRDAGGRLEGSAGGPCAGR
ncbi:MAG TPA: hypothetical protein VFZ97_03315 [Acidimicrobiales bacterium]